MQNKRNRRALPIVAAVLVAGGAAAALMLWPGTVKAGDIRRDPQAYEGRTVTLSGTVAGGASLGGALLQPLGGGGGIFLLEDGTGQVAVTTGGAVPTKGQRVTVRGPVQVVASVSVPDAWLRALGSAAGAGDGHLTAVVVRAEQIRLR